MAEEEFNHRRHKKGQKRDKISMDEFIRRKREAENIKVETDKSNTPEVQSEEQDRQLDSMASVKLDFMPDTEDIYPDRSVDSRQFILSETPPPLPMIRKETRPEIKNINQYGQPNAKPSKQVNGQRRPTVHEPRRQGDDNSKEYFDQRRKSYAVPKQDLQPLREANGQKSVMSDRKSAMSDRNSVISNRKTAISEFENDWQEGKTLAESNEYMLTNEIGCDVTFLVGPNEEAVSAHSFVLMSRSSKFYKLLSDQINQPSKLIIIPDARIDAFKNLIRYIYTDEFEFNIQDSMEMVPVADKYGSNNVKQMCFKNLLSEMSAENLCAILELAHEFEEQMIYEKCLHFIHVNGVDTLNAHGFRNLCRECVEHVVDSDDLYADEMSVFNGLVSWANAECNRRKLQPNDKHRREVLGKLLYCVRYSTMGVHDFTFKLSQNEILSADEKIVLYQFFHGKIQSLPLEFQKKGRRPRTIRSDIIQKSNKISGNSTTSDPYKSELPYQPPSNKFRNKDHLRVLRFQGINGTWRNNGLDAITFRCSASIIVLGIQLFGPPNGIELYEINVIVYDEVKVPLRIQDFTIRTDGSKVYDVILDVPILVPAWTPLTVQAKINGAPTIRGTDGVKFVSTEGVDFEFTSSCSSSNGTDETMGQIPSIMFCKP